MANVPSFRFSLRGNMRTYPRSDFRSGGTSECTLVPVFVLGEHPPKPPFWKTTLCQPLKKSGPKKQPKHRVFARDIPGTSGTQTSGYPGQKLYASGPFSVVLDREWPGCPGIWVGTSRIWKNFMQENFGLLFRSPKKRKFSGRISCGHPGVGVIRVGILGENFGQGWEPPVVPLNLSNPQIIKVSPKSGISKPGGLGNPWFAPRIPVVFVISVVSVNAANPALNSLFVAV